MFVSYNNLIRAGITLVVGFPLIWWMSNLISKSLKEKVSPHVNLLINKAIFYGGLAFLFTSVLDNLGFSLSALLGAAGVAGIAIGFAAQASVSNIISGIFLVFEQSFQVGDTITCDNVTGVVKSIDLFSVRLKTFDNKLVRLPSESLINKTVTNITFYPVRRLDITIRVATSENANTIIQHIIELAKKECKQCTQAPTPSIMINAITNTNIDTTLRVWTMKQEFYEVSNALMPKIKKSFEEKKITAWVSRAN